MTALQPPWATGTGGDTTNDDENSEWAPSNEPLSVFGVAEPGHGDVEDAEPESQQYGRDDQGGGSTPDVRLNLLNDVQRAAAAAAPVIEHHHVMETVERGSTQVRARIVPVTAQQMILLEENPDRRFAYVKVFTAPGLVLLGAHGMTLLGATAAAGSNGNGFLLADTDQRLKIETQAQVDVVLISGGPPVAVTVWEEVMAPKNAAPGVGL